MKPENESAQVSYPTDAIRAVSAGAVTPTISAAILWVATHPANPVVAPFVTGKLSRRSGLATIGLFAVSLALDTTANAIDAYKGNAPSNVKK